MRRFDASRRRRRGGTLNGGFRCLRFEPLEDRRVLATFTVTNLNDATVAGPNSAPGTLRQAVYDANHAAGADVIQFAANLSGTVSLTNWDDSLLGRSALVISSEITIRGNSLGITIGRGAAADEMRLFRVVPATGNLTLDSISLTGGLVHGDDGAAAGVSGGHALGGAIYNQGLLTIVSSTLYGNQAVGGDAGAGAAAGAGRGGALYNDHATVTIKNSTFSGNEVQSGTQIVQPPTRSYGGAIYTLNGTLSVFNSTISSNTAYTGRGIYILADNGVTNVNLRSSIVGQSDTSIDSVDFVTALDTNGQLFVTGANNLIRSQFDYHAISISTADPQLGPLANNGGPTMTHAIAVASLAVNQGDNSQSLVTDQRGGSFARVYDGSADIGAFELQSAPELPGDYNTNLHVDAADYVLWRKTLGAVITPYAGADGSGNGTIDAPDFDVWRAHFGDGDPPASATAVDRSVQDAVEFDGWFDDTTTRSVAATPPDFLPVRATVSANRHSRGAVHRSAFHEHYSAAASGQIELLLRTPRGIALERVVDGDATGNLTNADDPQRAVPHSGAGIERDAAFAVWPPGPFARLQAG